MKKQLCFLTLIILLLSNSFSYSQNDPILDSLQTLFRSSKNDTLKLRLRHQIGEQAMIFRPGYWDSIRIDAKKFGIKKTEGDALNNLGYIYQNLGDIERSLEYHKQSLMVLMEIGDKPGIAQSYNNMGTIYKEQGNTPLALDYFHRSLKIREETHDEEQMATALNNLAIVYEDQGDTAKALEYFKRSIGYYEKFGDMEGLGYPLSNIGIIEFARGNLDKAREYYDKSLAARLKADDKRGIGHCYNNIGAIYNKQGDYKTTLEYYNKSLEIFKAIGDKQGISFTSRNIGECYRNLKKYDLAFRYAEQALATAKEIGYTESIERAEELLSDLYREVGQFEKAYLHYRQYVIYKDSAINEGTRKAALKKQLQYDFEKKETLLKAEQEQREILTQAELKQQKIITLFCIAGGILVLVMLIIAFRGYRSKKKANLDLSEKNIEIETQKHIVEEKNKEIVDSINYAQRIQHALLAGKNTLEKNLPEHFVLFKPKDIVSGDFYWAAEKNGCFYLAVCDSTGHGVPGAFMSLLNISYLNEAITERGITQPNLIFNYVRDRLIESISYDGAKDGMDGILLCIDKTNGKISYSAAHNAPVLIQNGILTKLECDKMPVGFGERKDSFKLYHIDEIKGSTLYLSTDGYADQFGGSKGKKLKSKHLQEKLFEISNLNMKEQQQLLDTYIEEWRGDLAQVDDICIIGIRL
jgi:tetratricopeptide (TPR) repeat protein/serine phosphatase RsbU (regulator of sigma subunit)